MTECQSKTGVVPFKHPVQEKGISSSYNSYQVPLLLPQGIRWSIITSFIPHLPLLLLSKYHLKINSTKLIVRTVKVLE